MTRNNLSRLSLVSFLFLLWCSGQASGVSSSTTGSPSLDPDSAPESMMALTSEDPVKESTSSSLRDSMAVRRTTLQIEIYFWWLTSVKGTSWQKISQKSIILG